MKTIYLILAATVLSVGLFFAITSPGKTAYVTNEEIFSVHKENIPKGIPIVMSRMREALNVSEKGPLIQEYTELLSHFGIIHNHIKTINSSRTLSSKAKIRINQLEYLLTDTERTSQELKNEIGPPAESLDEKLMTTIGQVLVVTELTSMIKEGLSDTSLKSSAEELHREALLFLKLLNDFKNNFIEAILLDQTKEENQHIVQAFLNNNSSQYNEYDANRLFSMIQHTQTQLRQQFDL